MGISKIQKKKKKFLFFIFMKHASLSYIYIDRALLKIPAVCVHTLSLVKYF